MATVQSLATPHHRSRALIASALTAGLVLIFILNPDATQVYATNMFGGIRTPGEAAFIAGHRGDQNGAPENTMPAFELAMAGPVDYVETDIQLSADGVPVLIHDPTVDRTTNGTGAVADLTLDQLKALDAGSWYGPRFAGTRIPTLGEFLAPFAGAQSTKAMLELKGEWTPDRLRTVVDLIYRFGVQNRVVMASFELPTLAMLAQIAPPFPRVLIQRDIPVDPVATLNSVGAFAMLTRAAAVKSDPKVVKRMHKAGLQIVLYTLDSAKNWKKALGYGVDGIITDSPSTLAAWLEDTAPSA